MGKVQNDEVVVDVARHAGELTPDKPVPKPRLGGNIELDDAVLDGE